MKRKINPTLLGAFVLGAVVLAVVGVVFLGAIKWSGRELPCVFFFDESVNGLNPGAAIKYRGIKVGEVSRIMIAVPGQKEQFKQYIPVVANIDLDTVEALGGHGGILSGEDAFRDLVASGMRGQLTLESVITGLYYIEVDTVKRAAPWEPIQDATQARYHEFPTVPSSFAALGSDVGDMVAKIASVDFPGTMAAITGVLAAAEYRLNDARIDTALDELDRMAREVSQAARAVSQLAEELERNPNALLTGKRQEEDLDDE